MAKIELPTTLDALRAITPTAWRYREIYEQGGDVDSIGRDEHVALRHIYKHLSLAYLNPEVVNHILSNQCQISVRDMLDKASRSNDFAEQKKLFDFQQHL